MSTSHHQQDPEVQLRDLRAFAASRGWEVIRCYVDHGYSGTTSYRPALNELMADAQRKKFDVVMCWRFDRMARNTAHLLRTLEIFRSLSIQFISYQENIDTTTPIGQAMFTIVALSADDNGMAETGANVLRNQIPLKGCDGIAIEPIAIGASTSTVCHQGEGLLASVPRGYHCARRHHFFLVLCSSRADRTNGSENRLKRVISTPAIDRRLTAG